MRAGETPKKISLLPGKPSTSASQPVSSQQGASTGEPATCQKRLALQLTKHIKYLGDMLAKSSFLLAESDLTKDVMCGYLLETADSLSDKLEGSDFTDKELEANFLNTLLSVYIR